MNENPDTAGMRKVEAASGPAARSSKKAKTSSGKPTGNGTADAGASSSASSNGPNVTTRRASAEEKNRDGIDVSMNSAPKDHFDSFPPDTGE
jgi:hypothetical protein